MKPTTSHPKRANGVSCILAVLLVTSLTASAAEVREVLGRQYVKQDNHWLYRDSGGWEFRVQPDVITVKFKANVGREAEAALHASLDTEELRRARTGFIDIEIEGDVFDAIDAYMASGLVEIAEPNTIGEYTIVPDDTLYPSQWHLPIMSAEEAWDITPGAPSTIVAILDSGTEFTHEDMGPGGDAFQNIWLNAGEDAWADPDDPATGNGIDDDLNGYIDDWKGYDFNNDNNDGSGTFFHGTAVAGATGAKTHNATGVAGIAGGWNSPGTRLMICGVGDSGPNGAILDDAILYAGENGAQVVQLSLSVAPAAAIDAAIQMVHDTYNMTVICSSGNGGGQTVGYPASNPNVIAVGATDSVDQRANFSSHGPDVEVSAPRRQHPNARPERHLRHLERHLLLSPSDLGCRRSHAERQSKPDQRPDPPDLEGHRRQGRWLQLQLERRDAWSLFRARIWPGQRRGRSPRRQCRHRHLHRWFRERRYIQLVEHHSLIAGRRPTGAG